MPKSTGPWDARDLELEGNEPNLHGLPAAVEAQITYELSRHYGLRHDEQGIFQQGWRTHHAIAQFGGDEAALKAYEARARGEVELATPRLKQAVLGQPADVLGHRIVHRRPLAGQKYVVFSDHHFIFAGHRTNFFGATANLGVYTEALGRYADAGFSVVENGDVEDLVFFDPAFRPDEARIRSTMDFEALNARRMQIRREQLHQTLHDAVNQPLVQVCKRLAAEGRLLRTAGNHDYDEQDPAILAVLQGVYPGIEVPADYLLLQDAAGAVRYAICHGHQWDPTCAPGFGQRLGETISETLGIFTQGPDRTWRWMADDVRGWALGQRPFLNDLVQEPVSFADTMIEANKRRPLVAGSLAGDAERFIDMLAGKDIGWDYFIHADPLTAVLEEVLTGDRFFKFRLLDEERIRQTMTAAFADGAVPQPTLVLGHTHEVRFHPWSRSTHAPFAGYLNSGSAGRFENLIWGIEIVDGHASLVSWSRAELPTGPVERREWSMSSDGQHGMVRASTLPAPVP